MLRMMNCFSRREKPTLEAISPRFGRGAITGKCKQPPVVSLGFEKSPQPSTTRRIDAVRIPGDGMNRRGALSLSKGRIEAPPEKASSTRA